MIVGFWLWFWSSFITYFLFCAFVWQPCVSSVSLMVSLVSTALYLTCLFEGIWMAWKKNEWKREREKKKESFFCFCIFASPFSPPPYNPKYKTHVHRVIGRKNQDSWLIIKFPNSNGSNRWSVFSWFSFRNKKITSVFVAIICCVKVSNE